MPDKRHYQAASQALNKVYSTKDGLFSRQALANAGTETSSFTKADIHKERAKLVLGNIFTAGVVNLYRLHKGASRLERDESNKVITDKVTQFSHTYASKYGVSGEDLDRRVQYDLGFRTTAPEVGGTPAEALAFNVNYSRLCEDPVVAAKMAEFRDGYKG
ncbi:MAG TPA: hypothetical protein VFC47_14735 [Caulobacteraceae bacterium]|nr:hypothetical protein [Caulobacteraceae bacterium]